MLAHFCQFDDEDEEQNDNENSNVVLSYQEVI